MTLLQTFFPELYFNDHYTSTTVPYNLIKRGDMDMLLEMNVAGIPENSIDVEVLGNKLTVSAKAETTDGMEYIHQGISTKSFTHSFTLKDDVVVKSASVKNGILSILLEAQIPEEKRPRKILLTH